MPYYVIIVIAVEGHYLPPLVRLITHIHLPASDRRPAFHDHHLMPMFA